jgi:uncharacterized protein HemX
MHKKKVVISIIVVLIFLVTGVGFWKWKSNQKSKLSNNSQEQQVKQSSKQNQAQENQGKIIESEVNSVTGLKTYTNEEYKYAFDYPGDWVLTNYYGETMEVDNDKKLSLNI